MEAFQKLSKEEQGQAFAAAGNQLGLPAYIIEKDFHVTVVLGYLFGPIWHQLKAGNTHDPFVFKGGRHSARFILLLIGCLRISTLH